MEALFLKYCDIMQYVDLFVRPVWNFFNEMNGVLLFIVSIILICIAAAITYGTGHFLFASDENVDISGTLGMFAAISKLVFLPMVAVLSYLLVFSGSGVECFVTMGFVRKDLRFTLCNIADWDVYFSTFLIIVISVRFLFVLIANIIRLDVIGMVRVMVSMLAAMTFGMSIGHLLLWTFQSDNVLFRLVATVLAVIVTTIPALAIHFCVFGWIYDIFSPLFLLFRRIWDAGDFIYVDDEGNPITDKHGNVYHTNLILMLASLWDL